MMAAAEPHLSSAIYIIVAILGGSGIAGIAALWRSMLVSRAEVKKLRVETDSISEGRKHLIDEAANLAVISMKEALVTVHGEVKRLEIKLENANTRISNLELILRETVENREKIQAELQDALKEKIRLQEQLITDRRERDDLKEVIEDLRGAIVVLKAGK